MTSCKANNVFSCDLIHQSKCHILFLKALHLEGITLQRPSLESLRRYRDLWLPLVLVENKKYNQEVKEESNESDRESVVDLIPPPDIAWLWHCHRLAPYRYMDYIQATLLTDDIVSGQMSFDSGKMSNAFERFHRERPFLFQSSVATLGPQDDSEYEHLCSYTQALWKKVFPHENFFLENQDEDDQTSSLNTREETTTSTDTMLGTFDVLDSCERQSAFLWQVSGERYCDDDFLFEGIENYEKFLNLMKSNPRPKFLVPTYQIDLMWHTHMLTSITNYHMDCVRITGSIVEHDDSLTDRTEGEVLDVNFKATKKLWYKEYGDGYSVRGGMYRGEPPQVYFEKSWSRQPLFDITHKKNNVLPDGLTLGHLIGEVGASSILSSSDIPWKSLKNSDAFIPAKPKSKIKGKNANEQKDGYVFGNGSKCLQMLIIDLNLIF